MGLTDAKEPGLVSRSGVVACGRRKENTLESHGALGKIRLCKKRVRGSSLPNRTLTNIYPDNSLVALLESIDSNSQHVQSRFNITDLFTHSRTVRRKIVWSTQRYYL